MFSTPSSTTLSASQCERGEESWSQGWCICLARECMCNKDMEFYPFSILFTFHYLAFVSHDSLPYLSVVVTCDNLLLSFKPPLCILCVRNSVVPHSPWKYSKWFEFSRVPGHSLGGVQSQNSVIHLSSPSITFLRISWEGAEIVQWISEASMISARYLLEPLSFPLFRPSFGSDRNWSQLGHHTIVISARHTTFIDSSPHLTHR